MAHHHEHSHAGFDWAGMAESLDLDGDVLQSVLLDATARLFDLTPTARRILDLGCGTGTGTFALARTFRDAHITAVDGSGELLAHLRDKASQNGTLARVTTLQADLDLEWPDVRPVDLTWAGMSLHHLANPERVLADAYDRTNPGGVFAAFEIDGALRFLPDGEQGDAEKRCYAIAERRHGQEMPHRGADWAPKLQGAGFENVEVQHFVIDRRAPLHPLAGRYAQRTLAGLRAQVDGRASAADLETLDAVLAGNGLLERDDLHLRGTRTLWTGRKAG